MAAVELPFKGKPVGLWRAAFRRLLRNPEGLIGLIIIVLFMFAAIFATQLAPYGLREIHLDVHSLPPAWVQMSKTGQSGDLRFFFGTDNWGRDLLTRVLYGAQTSMIFGIVSAPLIGLAGMLIGLVAGYAGGRLDRWIMRFTDVFYALPPLIICILTVLALKNTPMGKWLNGVVMLFVAFLAVSWAGAARLTRSSVMGVMHLEYIEAARCLGIPRVRLIFRHILPNVVGPLLVWVTLMVPQLILTEAILAYLQITPQPQMGDVGAFTYSWGAMILEGRWRVHIQPTVMLLPAACVGLVSIAFSFLGDALRDALDPASRK